MALFFDAPWFDERLARRGLDRAALAAVLGLDDGELGALYRDQRLLDPGEVVRVADLLDATTAEIAHRAGVGTPGRADDLPPAQGEPAESLSDAVDHLAGRLDDLDRRVAGIEGALHALMAGRPFPGAR